MKYLLNTHALLWWFTDDPHLSAKAREIIADENHEIFVRAASALEIATKPRLGKLPDIPDALTRFGELVAADGFQEGLRGHRSFLLPFFAKGIGRVHKKGKRNDLTPRFALIVIRTVLRSNSPGAASTAAVRRKRGVNSRVVAFSIYTKISGPSKVASRHFGRSY